MINEPFAMGTSAEVDFFPEAPRVIYDKAPLSRVICQLRFPSVLKIESSIPADFQERIRGRFPVFEKSNQILPTLPAGIPPNFAELLAGQAVGASNRFATEDGKSTIELSSSSIGFSEGNYTRWEAFRETIDLSLRALIEIYRPAYFTRIGLRYINLVNREKIGLEDAHWASLLSKDISSELSIPFFERNIDEFQKLIRINNPNGQGGFLLQHGIVKDQNATSKVYSIDFDFYHDKRTEVNLALAIADELHRLSGRAFRWAISDLLHSSLGPTAVDADEESRTHKR